MMTIIPKFITALTKYLTLGLILYPVLGVADQRPNVILIVADDLGYGDLSCYGAQTFQTPSIDALAKEGLRLTDANATAAVCQPSRYSILTGEYPQRIQKKGQYQTYFRPEQASLPSILKKAGYRTAMIGKWHNGFGRGSEPDYNQPNFCASTPGTMSYTPLDLGFESFFGTPRSHNEPPSVFAETVTGNNGQPTLRILAHDPQDPIAIHPSEKDPLKKPEDDYGHGFSRGAKTAHAARPVDQIDQIYADKAVQYLSQPKGEQPFFLYLAFNAPHVPLAPAPAFKGQSGIGDYGDFILQLDAGVGKVMSELKRLKLDQNTLVILTSDNGGLFMGGKSIQWKDGRPVHRPVGKLIGQKTDGWEGGHRVPCIVKWPAGKIPANATCERLTSLSDLMATVAAATQTPLGKNEAIDSINQLPLWLNPTLPSLRKEMPILGTKGTMLRTTDAQGINWAYLPFRGSGGESIMDRPNAPGWGQRPQSMGFINSDIEFLPNGAGRVKPEAPATQLYNLTTDPQQSTNIVAQFPELAKTLDSQLKKCFSNMP